MKREFVCNKIIFAVKLVTLLSDFSSPMYSKFCREVNIFENYCRTLNIEGLSNDDRIRLRKDFRDKNRKQNRLIKESRDKIDAEEDRKMQNEFETNKKLFWKSVNKPKTGSGANDSFGIKNADCDIVWDTDKVKACVKPFSRN